MTDYFALLGLARRPGIDDEALQENYLRLAAAWHPDAVGGDADRFRELQEGRRILSEPALRLRHLLDLEGHEAQGGGAHGSPELFMEVAGTLDAAKTIRRKYAECRSAIGKASLEPERRKVEQRIQSASEQLRAHRETLAEQLQKEDARWPGMDHSELERIGKSFVFLDRWSKELREGLFQLRNPA